MCRNPVPQPRRNLSGIGRGADIWEKAASAVTAVTWGARGSLHMRSVAPGPMCAEVCPLAIARDLPIPVAPARFRAWGQGHTPAPRFQSRHCRDRVDNLATTIAFAIQGDADADDIGDLFSFPNSNMDHDDYVVTFAATHGAIEGTISEPYWIQYMDAKDQFEESLITISFVGRTDGKFPKSDFDKVLQELVDFYSKAEARRKYDAPQPA